MDREKVIKGLECCAGQCNYHGCPYKDPCENANGVKQIMLDALALLKEQEDLGTELTNAVELIHKKNERIDKLLKEQEAMKVQYTAMGGLRYGACPQCDARIDNLVNPKACGFCGQKLDWEGR